MLHLTENAKVVLEKRYLLRNAHGQIMEDEMALFKRVASAIAEGDRPFGASDDEIDTLTQSFFQMLSSLAFLPNSPTLMNAGKPQGQLSACFVLPIPDSLEGIFETLKQTAIIHQSGGGTGFSFSRLRPKGDILKYTSGVTSGPISFMEVYNAATEAIKQGGTRRGANMGILSIDHPDIEDFIQVKNDLSRLTNFNISVAVTETFMRAVKENKPFDLIHPKSHQVVKTIPARYLMDLIIESAWQTGEPGLIFIDRINQDNITPSLGDIEATNPCGEVPLLPYEACNLGSINMAKMLRTNQDTDSLEIDWEAFRSTIHLAVHFLENVIVQNTFPIPEIKAMVEGNRKIGLGLMGWADALLALGIPYHSEQAIDLAEQVMAFLSYHSKYASIALAKSRGPFPNFDQSVYAQGHWFSDQYQGVASGSITPDDWKALDEAILKDGIRHATTTSLAPTGTISIIANASGGIEPLFALVFIRNVLENTELIEVNSYFQKTLEALGLYNDALLKTIMRLGSIQSLDEIPEAIRKVFVTAQDIEPYWHLRMQAAFQRYCDNAVSKTINFAETTTRENIAQAYELANDLKLKGVTVYRDNSRLAQPMSIEKVNGKSSATITDTLCPECHKPLQLIEGCFQCPDCLYAFCG